MFIGAVLQPNHQSACLSCAPLLASALDDSPRARVVVIVVIVVVEDRDAAPSLSDSQSTASDLAAAAAAAALQQGGRCLWLASDSGTFGAAFV